MVAQRFLVPFVGVQIPVSLPPHLRAQLYLGAFLLLEGVVRDFFISQPEAPSSPSLHSSGLRHLRAALRRLRCLGLRAPLTA